MGRNSTTSSLAPGFRFHPTDEELVQYYLKRKLSGKAFHFDAISDVDVYKAEPWDLPSKSKLKTRDLEWYFFSVLDKKYGNKCRTNRATGKGYWKTTGKDRAVNHGSRVVGMKKTLVYHNGRAPKGERTNWVMHEYRLTDEELEKKSGIIQDAIVLCRIFQKSGPGPKNGEKYGAPFIEEEWEDDEETYLPGEEAPLTDDLTFGEDDGYLGLDDLDQRLAINIAPENVPLPPNFYYGECSKLAEAPKDIMKDDQEPTHESFATANGLHLGGSNNLDNILKHPVDPVTQSDEPEDVDSFNIDYLLDEPFFDATGNPTFDEGLFIEADDLWNSNEADASGLGMLEEYLSKTDEQGIQGLDSSQVIGSESYIADQSLLTQKPLNEAPMPSEHILKASEGCDSLSSYLSSESENIESVTSDKFISKARNMLGNIHAPSAYASEFPSEEAMLQLRSAMQPSNSVHVTAGLISIANLPTSDIETDWLATKNSDVDLYLPHGLSQGLGSASLVPLMDMVSGKSGSSMSRGFWYLFFIWVLVISISFKVGSIIWAR